MKVDIRAMRRHTKRFTMPSKRLRTYMVYME
jgi:hypothetical protein